VVPAHHDDWSAGFYVFHDDQTSTKTPKRTRRTRYRKNDKRDLKITVRFLSNEIRSDALKIIVHERICTNNNCVTNLIDSKISGEIQLAILKKATLMEKESIEKLVKERRKKDPRGGDNAIPQDQQ